MEGVSTGTVDKSRVLNVKPLRTLVPMFPNPPQAPPFISSSPFGPFPSGFYPFYPFSASHQDVGLQSPAADAVPLRSFSNPQMGHGAGISGMNGNIGSSQKKPKRVPDQSEANKKREKAVLLGLSLSQAEQDNGNRELVNYVMLKYDSTWRRLTQLEESKAPEPKLRKTLHFTTSTILTNTGVRTNSTKRVGVVPGVEIGDIFYFRMEMLVVGLHALPMAGIDYMIIKDQFGEDHVTVSIVSSGEYDDGVEDKDVLVYTGHGGNTVSKDKDASDQKLIRGNLALDRSARRGNEIRVIRGFKDADTANGKIYVYDGLYSIKDSWIEKGKSGANNFKYKLVRTPGQTSAFAIWQSIQKWKQGVVSRPGLIHPDLSSGAESIPVILVNDVDDEKGLPYFTYSPTVAYSQSFSLTQRSSGCHCKKECAAHDQNCVCIHKNGGDFPYTANGILVSRKPLMYECGKSCSCVANCKNRVLQTGIKARLEVFKTKNRGWGLQSWDPIRAGTFICEYAGEVIDKALLERNEANDNDYIFDTTRARDSSFKWNYDPRLIDENATADVDEEHDLSSPVVISAKNVGNVGRFMNHSCSPNVFWQLIVTEKDGESLIRVGFFAIRHIPPLTELTYDYGVSQSEHRRKQCLCGSQKCKGYFG